MPSIEEVEDYLRRQQVEVWRYEQPTPTSEAAAAAVGCSVAEIAKSLLFIVGGTPVMVVTCGDMKVKSSLLKQGTGTTGKVKLPQAEEVIALTGYAPGGVCPFLLPAQLPVYLDQSLRRFGRVYAAAGNDASAVPVTTSQLECLTQGRWIEACEAK